MKTGDGKILRVNLSTGKILAEPSTNYARLFLGGRGVNQKILFNELPPNAEPLKPENLIAFGTGPLVGTLAPSACRLNIDSKNVFTNGIGSSSCGGNFAPELRFAGYDNIIVKGKAETPVYLFIDNLHVELNDASHLWGHKTWETDRAIKEEKGDDNIKILCIGPAGENMVKAACVITDFEKAAGRCGLGAVMGAKKLKAIAVRGTGSIEIAEPGSFKEAVEDVLRKLSKSEYLQRRGEVGIYGQVLWGENFRETAWRNYQGGYAPDAKQTAGVHPDVFYKMKQKSISCFSCPIHCRQLHRIPDGPSAGLLSEGLESNDILNFSAKLNIFDASIILKLRVLCNQYGLDVDNTAGVIAWAFECYQRGIISDKDTDGLKLKWGNHEVIIELIRKMTYREGFGNILAEGSKKASEIIGGGSEAYSINIKGQELMETIWSDKGWAFGTVVSPRGGTHTRGAVFSPRFAGMSPEASQKYYGVKTIAKPTTYEGKAELVVLFERLQAVADSLGLCAFATMVMAPAPNAITSRDIAALYSAATGWEIDDKELLTAGERIHNLEKVFNVLHTNWTRQDDYPPTKFTQEPIKMPGMLKGESLNIAKWDEMLDKYYTLHGWDTETSWPTRKVLEKLDLKDIADVLQEARKLPQETR